MTLRGYDAWKLATPDDQAEDLERAHRRRRLVEDLDVEDLDDQAEDLDRCRTPRE